MDNPDTTRMENMETVTLDAGDWDHIVSELKRQAICAEVDSRRRFSTDIRASFARQGMKLRRIAGEIDAQRSAAVASRKAL